MLRGQAERSAFVVNLDVLFAIRVSSELSQTEADIHLALNPSLAPIVQT